MAERRQVASFTKDKEFEERFRPAVHEIICGVISTLYVDAYVAPDIEDFTHNKDWGVVIDLESLDRLSRLGVSSRIRRADQKAKRTRQGHRYTREFTVRATRPSGYETESHKMRLGYGGLMLYGFEAESGASELAPWVVLNLDVIRKWQASKRRWREHKSNPDGTSTFFTYWLEDVPEAAITAHHESIPSALIGCIARAEVDPRYAPYTRSDDWAETTRIHPDPTAPKGWLCPACDARTSVFVGRSNRYDPKVRLYVGGDTLRCIKCAIRRKELA